MTQEIYNRKGKLKPCIEREIDILNKKDDIIKQSLNRLNANKNQLTLDKFR